jgi:ferredoxin
MPKVVFVNEHRAVEVAKGTNLKTLAVELGINPHREFFKGVNCGYFGMCGTCQVWVRESEQGATSPRNLRERWAGTRGQRRLSCQVKVLGDIEVTTMGGGDDRLRAPRPISPPPNPSLDPTAKRKPIDASSSAQFLYGHPSAVGTGTRTPATQTAPRPDDDAEDEQSEEG